MFKVFRVISILEGLSFIAILSVSFGLLSRDFVFQLGMAHGVLFMLYLVFSLTASNTQQWPVKVWLPVFIASLIPFAFIPVEIFLSRVSTNQKTAIA